MIPYLIMFVGWSALWFSPRESLLNLGALVLALWLLMSSALIGALAPEHLRASVFWAVAHVAAFLVVGAGIVWWRKRQGVAVADAEFPLASASNIELAVVQSLQTIVRITLPFTAVLAIVFAGTAIWRGDGLEGAVRGVVLAFLLALIPLAPVGILWVVARIIRFIRRG